MRHFCLALPPGLHEKLAALCKQRGVTITSYIRGALAARVQADMTGQKFCADGSPCILALMPNYQAMASSSRTLLDSRSVLNPDRKTGA